MFLFFILITPKIIASMSTGMTMILACISGKISATNATDAKVTKIISNVYENEYFDPDII